MFSWPKGAEEDDGLDKFLVVVWRKVRCRNSNENSFRKQNSSVVDD
jgi:hypothetical protein